jgi:hypothetical protein
MKWLPLSDTPKSRVNSDLAKWLATGLVVVLGGLAMAWALWWPPESPAPSRQRPGSSTTSAAARSDPRESARYVGAASCRECHPGECALFARSEHARTLRPAASDPVARRLDGRTVADPERPGVAWSYRLRDGRFSVERREGAKVETFPIEFSFGSGQAGTTFVTTMPSDSGAPPVGIEHRLSHRTTASELVITPGQERGTSSEPDTRITPAGRLMGEFPLLRCFSCHVTTASARDRHRLDPVTMVPNVSCERCHGPAGAHVDAARRGASAEELLMPLGPDQAAPRDQIAACGECHRTPDDVEPGGVRTDNLSIVRFQPVGMVQSKCFQMGNSGLRCTSCHDPHARLSRDMAAYEAVCLDCHRSGGPARTPCPVSSVKGCVGCHMPRREAMPGAFFTDHWIRVDPERPAPRTARNGDAASGPLHTRGDGPGKGPGQGP